MARQRKKGLQYFPFDVNFFKDRKIRRLYSRYGSDGVVVYLYILCAAYESDGYYLRFDEYLNEDIGFELNMSEEKIGQIINYLCRRSLLDSTLLTSVKVLTSRGIQARFQEAVKQRASKTAIEVDPRYWLLDESETETYIKVAQKRDNSEKNSDNSEKNSDNSEKNDTKKSKVNKNKVNEIKGKKEERNTPAFLPPNNEELVRCLRTYEKYIGLVTPNVVEGLEFCFSQKMEASLIVRLIESVAERGGTKRSWQYLHAALMGNLNAGIRTLDAYNRAQADYVAQTRSTQTGPKKRSRVNYQDTNPIDYDELERSILDNTRGGL